MSSLMKKSQEETETERKGKVGHHVMARKTILDCLGTGHLGTEEKLR